jgi:hypothetical protein
MGAFKGENWTAILADGKRLENAWAVSTGTRRVYEVD